MLFIRLFLLLTWPIRAPFILLGRLLRGRARAPEAALAGGGAKLEPASQRADARQRSAQQRTSLLWKVPRRVANDETVIRPDQQELAAAWAEKALKYYALQLELFPERDFYEDAERDHFISEVANIETDGVSREDQFIEVLKEARRTLNANARTLYCELAPLGLIALLIWHAAMLLFDPLDVLPGIDATSSLQAQLQAGAGAIALGGVAVGVAILFIAFVYRFSFTHIQRQNAQELNSFIQSEFTSLNQSFNVARAECMQAETRFGRAEHDKVEPNAKAWALTYHWIAIRQLAEELTIRNTMFQIRRNTWLYKAGGALFCAVLGAAAAFATFFLASPFGAPSVAVVALVHLLGITLAFLVICYGLIMTRPFDIVKDCLPKDEWSRLYKLRVGEAIAEQVGRDKKQIVLQRDRGAAG